MSLSESMKGNQNAKKLTNDELAKAAYDQYCDHLSKGKSKRSWWFEHPDLTLTWETMEKYIKAGGPVFDPQKKAVAENKGYAKWEQIVEDSASGADKGKANTASLQMVMRNKFGWDKQEKKHDDESAANASALAKLMNHLDKKPSSDSNIAHTNEANL